MFVFVFLRTFCTTYISLSAAANPVFVYCVSE